MSRTAGLALVAAAALGGCDEVIDPGSCGSAPGCTGGCEACAGDFYACESGEWVYYFCDPALPLELHGVLTLHQSIQTTDGVCAPAEPRDPLTFTVIEEPAPGVSAEPPITVTESDIVDDGEGNAGVFIRVTDDWGDGIARSIVYRLEATPLGTIAGTATATHDSCTELLFIDGVWGDP